jgi:hypothetical protein
MLIVRLRCRRRRGRRSVELLLQGWRHIGVNDLVSGGLVPGRLLVRCVHAMPRGKTRLGAGGRDVLNA